MKRLATFLAVLLTVILLIPGGASADVNDFTITKFEADYTLTQADPQGTLIVSEHLTVDFTDQNHGILRALPKKYNGQPLNVHITSVRRDDTTEPYTTYTSNGNEVLKIGSADSTITGQHTYDISYEAENVIRFTEAHDEFIWNTNGTEWSQPFLAETARLHIPTELTSKFSDAACYTGAYKSSQQDCVATQNGSEIVYTTTRSLNAGETMTFAGDFPVGTFASPTAKDWLQDNGFKLAALVLPGLFAFTIGYRKWRKDGRDIGGRGTIVPEYAPPKDLTPAEADTLRKFHLSTTGVSATIIDLAIRKYLKIVENKTDGSFGRKKTSYTFVQLDKPATGLAPHEKLIYDQLFADRKEVEVASLKNSFYKTVQEADKHLHSKLELAGFFPKKMGTAWLGLLPWMILFAIAAFLGTATTMWQLFVGCSAAVAILIGFAIAMPKRTPVGVAAKESLEGLKLYMNTAEKDRIAMLQSPNAPYADKSAEPQKTVELFEKLLPFAIVMGVESEWAKQFEGIYTTPPDWYGGNWTSFNTGYLVGSLNGSMQAMNTSFAAPSSSGSGGSGGFSGGGGGGGGGGGW